MNILIIGASGFIGKHLCQHFGKLHNVYGLSRGNKTIDGCKTVISCDLLNNAEENFDELQNSINCKIAIILNLASLLVGTDNSKNQEILFDNLRITLSIVELTKLLDVQKIINFSTMAVYPNLDGKYSETSIIWTASNTECIYGLSKFCAENLLSFYLSDRNIVHLRLAQVYGDGMRDDRIMPMMLKELMVKNQITVYGNGKRISNFIHIQKLLKIIDFFVNHNKVGIFNVGDESLSYESVAKRTIEQYGDKDSKIIYLNKGSKSKFVLDTEKLNNLLKEIKDYEL